MATLKFLTVCLMLLTIFTATIVLFLANRVRPVRLRVIHRDRNAGRRMVTR